MFAFISEVEDEAVKLVAVLSARSASLATVESCTGGLIGAAITSVSGSSAVYIGGWVTYSNSAKSRFVSVPEQLIAHHGAVSPPVASAMAVGGRTSCESDFSIAVTGIAGPGGGSAAKPVGLVFISVASSAGVEVQKQTYDPTWSRAMVRGASARDALAMCRRIAQRDTAPAD